uniref:BTB domain-containing protein n=1 Tax=Panagrolaimus sp. ES5 TaxID=591445 RepID=A0AC34FHE1_9BILA
MNSKFADVTLISSDGIEIPSHRCILAEYSKVFAKLFEESEQVPSKIYIEDFDADLIRAALKLCFGQENAVIKNDEKLYTFFNKYEIFHYQ